MAYTTRRMLGEDVNAWRRKRSMSRTDRLLFFCYLRKGCGAVERDAVG